MGSVGLFLELMSSFEKVRPGEDLQVTDQRRVACGANGRSNRRNRAQARVEDEHAPGAEPQQSIGNLGNSRLESIVREADTSRIGDEGRIGSVRQRRPDQRIDPLGERTRKIFSEHLIGGHRHMEAMLLGAGPNRQDRCGAGSKPLPDLVPGETGHLML
jgi:hypothetical protein